MKLPLPSRRTLDPGNRVVFVKVIQGQMEGKIGFRAFHFLKADEVISVVSLAAERCPACVINPVPMISPDAPRYSMARGCLQTKVIIVIVATRDSKGHQQSVLQHLISHLPPGITFQHFSAFYKRLEELSAKEFLPFPLIVPPSMNMFRFVTDDGRRW